MFRQASILHVVEPNHLNLKWDCMVAESVFERTKKIAFPYEMRASPSIGLEIFTIFCCFFLLFFVFVALENTISLHF